MPDAGLPSVRPRPRFGPSSACPGAACRASVLLCVALATAMVTGCSRSRAAELTAGPPLAVPAPPPRVLPSVEAEAPLAAASGTTDTPLAEAPEVVQDRVNVSPQRPAATTARPDPPPSAPAPSPPATPVSELPTQVQLEGDEAARRRDIAAMIRNAESDLKRVSRVSLNRTAQLQYDDAVNALRHAREFLDKRNLQLAETQARKAATLAADLAR